MKTKIRRFSKSVLSVILAMTLIISTMLIGTISVNAAVSTLYVIGDAVSQGDWSNWKELSSKTADNTIAYTTIAGNKEFKVSTAKEWNKYDGISLDNSLGDVTINGEFSNSSNLSTSNTNSTIYICVRLEDGHIYASTTEPVTTYTVTYGKVGSGTVTAKNGDTQISDNPATVNANTKVTFTAKAETGYQFDGWYSDSNCSTQLADSSSTTYEVTVTENTTVYAKFTAIPVEFRLIGLSDTTFNYDNGIEFNEERYVTVTVTADDISGNNHYFQIADGTNIYGSYGNSDATFDIVSHISSSKYGVNNTTEFNGKFKIGTAGTYKIYYEKQTGTGINVWCEKVITTYTITKGTVDTAKGDFTVTVNGTSAESAEAGDTITVTTNPNTANNYVVDKVTYTPENGTKTEVTASNDTYTFEMPASNVTVNVTFKSKSTEPAEKFYLEYWDGKTHQFIPYTSYADGVFTWETKFDFGSFSSDGKFRLTNTTTWTDGSESSFCVPAYKRTNQKGTKTYVTVTAVGASVETDSSKIDGEGSYGVSKYNDIKLNGIDTSKTYVVTYKIGETHSLDGQITIADKSVTPTPKLSLSPTSANLAVGGTLKLTATHTDCEGTVSFASNAEGVATVSELGVVTAVAKGTATITATCTNGETATCTVTVSAIPNEQSDRIYAYAGTDATPKAQGWIAAEYAAAQQQVYNNEGETNETSARQFPSLGATTQTNLRLFLPTSASSEQVVLYNSFSYDIKINNITIPAGGKAPVSYTPGATYKVYNGETEIKTLTIYKSDAQGALYLNNTGEYSSFDENGVPEMLRQLYLGKDAGEIGEGLGNAGAYSDSTGTVTEIGVKKIKGRGNSTWNYTDKKSFNVTFADKFKGFGFTKTGKKYSLLANFKDASLSRNKILYQLAKLMGAKYVPEVATIDLYMNGLYMGSYLMCQKIEVGPNEVVNDEGVTGTLLDIKTSTEEEKAATIAAANAGFSFLMELDSNSKDGADYLIKVGDQKITLKEPEYLDDNNYKYKDALTTAIDTFVTKKYTDLNNAIGNTSITYDELNKIIDVKSLANYYLLNELAKNYDIGVTSTYLVYNKTDDKFYISPVWDLDVSTGNCNKTNNNYTSYEGNWTNDNSAINYFMKKVFDNPQVQSAARAKWTDSYYTELVNNINALVDGGTLSNEKTVTGAKQDISGSYENNFKKWSYPYGFTAQDDNIIARKSLTTASYDVSTHTYSKASSDTLYGEGETAQDTINYVKDWLLSRVAWMTNKYNTYTIGGLDKWQDSDRTAMENKGDGTHVYTITSTISSEYGIKVFSDYNLNLGLSSPENGTSTCINFDRSLTVVDASENGSIESASGENMNCAFSVTSASAEAPVYLIYNQKTNTLTLSDTLSTSSNPFVTLEGSTVDNADIKDGTAVTLTAKITPATSNNVVVTGDYTATLYIGDKVVTTKTVTFADNATEETTMNAVFSTYLEGTNQTYKVVVTCNDGEQDRKGTSKTVTYKQTGVKDQKIYFDPSTHTTTVDSNTVYDWLDATTKDSTVTVTITDSSSKPLDTFTMYIDSDDIHGLDKGVFRGDISEETLAYFKDSSNTITFTMDNNTSLTYSVAGQSDITSGWIYNYSSETGQALWEQYNVSYEEAYPSSRTDSKYANITTFAQFKDYIKDQKALKDAGQATDNIVYFDNSVSKWYNVYIYGWEQSTGSPLTNTQATIMKKLPYADIWYYDFGTAEVKSNFLFKDRSGPGFGNNYQETVDLVDGYIKNGDGAEVQLFFETTLTNSANPIFVTQNFYNSTIKKASDGTYDETLKYRAFNTQWDEFATILSNTVQTKAVDVYFDLHDKATDVANIQLYHSSTNYTFASAFTRLTQMSGSTIFHASILLPYTDNGIAFKFDKFVVNYSDSSTKTCAMSANVQPEFTCINTGEVWYEINSDFASVDYDTSASSLNLIQASSPLLNVSGEVTPSVVYVPKNLTVGGNTVSGIYLWSDNSEYIEYPYDSTLSNLVDFPVVKIQNNEYYAVSYNITDGSSNFHFLLRSLNNQTKECTGYTVGNSYIITNTEIANQGTATYRTTTETTVYVAGNFADKNNDVNHFAVFSGSGSLDYDFAFTATEYTYNGYTVYKAVAIDVSTRMTYAHIDASDNADSKRISNIINNDTVGNYNNQLYYFAGSDSSENRWISNWGETVEPTISLSAASTSLTLVGGTASTTLTSIVTNASGKTVTYSVDNTDGVTLTPSANTLSADFEVTKVGTYVVTATIEGTTATAQVTITVSEPVIKDYCGVLAYNHSTATFDVTGGGTIDNTDVVLTNGYYKNTAGDNTVTTGYTSYDGTTYTVIYALPSTASSGATTSYSSTTSHSNEGTGEGQYSFDGWTKDGVISTENKTMSDAISGTATVAYVANWSEEVMVTYTFTYVYDMYDTKTNGKEYHENGALTKNSDYKVQVSLSVNATRPDVIAAYLANAPKISSDYFTYTFDDTKVAISTDLTNHTAEATAKIASVKKYKVTFNNQDGIVPAGEYFYQNIVTLTQSAPSGYVTVWKDEKGNTLYVGDSYSFRITRNIIIESESVTSSSLKPATYVNEPTYEFFTSGTTEYVKFKVRVDNVLAGVTPDKYGTLYFFTDENGVPVDSTISVDSNINSDKLTAAALGSASTGIKKYDATDIVNADHKFIYAPYIKNTAANRDRYLRVYSYYIYKDEEGNDVVVISSDSVLASIRNALNES